MTKAHTILVAFSICLVLIMYSLIPKIDSYKPVNQQVTYLTDEEVEDSLYTQTGVKQDFMGVPYENKGMTFDYTICYHIDINDTFTVVYTSDGKFVTTVPYVEGSAWDEAMSWENL